MSLELPTRNDLVPRCCLRIYDDSPFEMLRNPYMLPSMTIMSLSIVPYNSNDGATYSLIVGQCYLKETRTNSLFLSRQTILKYFLKYSFSHLHTFKNYFKKRFITLLRTDTRVIIKQTKIFKPYKHESSFQKMSKYLRAHGKPRMERVLTPSLSIVYPPYP